MVINKLLIPILLATCFIFLLFIHSENWRYSNHNKYPSSSLDFINHNATDQLTCQVVDFDPFDPSMAAYYRNLTGKTFECPSNSVLKVRRVDGSQLEVINADNVACFVSGLIRVDDKHYNFSDEISLSMFNQIAHNFTGVRVNCYDSQNKSKIIFSQTLPIIPSQITEKNQVSNLNATLTLDVPSVLLLGIDSVSRLNFERHLTMTKKLLNEKGFVPLKGYNKVGLNTFPNMVPFYTGYHPEELGFNLESYKEPFDNWPFIWKDFKKSGHVTMYAEDWPSAETFHYFKPGFKQDPVDIYLRTWSLAVDNYIEEAKIENSKRSYLYCLNGTKEIEVYYNYTYDFIEEMTRRQKKYFASVFMVRTTHDTLNNAHYVDQPIYTLLNKLFDNNLLDNTVVMVFSDHSLRYGAFGWTTTIGTMEARLPMMNIYLPKTIQLNTSNLLVNQNRLTTHFDTHATLLHLVTGRPPTRSHVPYGISLFEEIPKTRTCTEAGIPLADCGCGIVDTIENYSLLDNKLVVESAKEAVGQVVIKQMNKYLEPVAQLCLRLHLKEVDSLHVHSVPTSVNHNVTVLRAILIAKPSGGRFEAILKLDIGEEALIEESQFPVAIQILRNKHKIEIIQIERLNSYDKQAKCLTPKVTDSGFLKNYCMCVT